MQICAKRAKAAEGVVFPSNSGSKPHKAYAWRDGAAEAHGAFCSCQAFIFGRSKIAKAEGVPPQEVTFVCKHLQNIFDTHCGWRQQNESDYRFDRTCPKCGGDVIDSDDDMLIPTDTEGAVHDLRTMLAEIDGTEAPPPIQPERPFTVEVEVEWTEKRTFTVMARDEMAARAAAMDTWQGHPVGSPAEAKRASVLTASEGDTAPAPAEAKPAKRAPKAAAAKPNPAAAKKAAANLAATVRPRKRTA